MAATLLTTYNKYIGLSTDTKPTDNIKIGSRFLETDTDKKFIFNGTSWDEITGLEF